MPRPAPPHKILLSAIQRAFLLGAVLAVSPAAAQSNRIPVNDASVESAIERSVRWLQDNRNERGNWEQNYSERSRYWGGETGLALLALIYAGQNPRDDQMNRSLEWLAAQELSSTYCYSIRAHVLSRVGGTKFRERLEQDLDWLLRAAHPARSAHAGAFGYEKNQRGNAYDNSNSQFGVLGIWMAAEAGAHAERLDAFWKLAERHWLAQQRSDGGWTYRDSYQKSTGSMTAAGLTSLYVVLDYAHAASGHRKASELIAAIERGLDWFGRAFDARSDNQRQQWKYYYLYGVERAGRASGRKYFRGHSWFRIGAEDLLKAQNPAGDWEDQVVQTAFALMFLAHGRSPLLLNKLEHGDDWDNYLRDAAGLARYARHAFERQLNWQIISLDHSLFDLLEAPILYLHGTKAWTFSGPQVSKLRAYVERGGMLLAVAGREGEAFTDSMRELAYRLYPDRDAKRVPEDHVLFSGGVQFQIAKRPEMYELHNGVRPLMLICTDDLAFSWNRYHTRNREDRFLLGCNLYLYATDKAYARSRLDSTLIPFKRVEIKRRIRIARIESDGNWNPEPYGWERFANYLNNTIQTELAIEPGVRLDSGDLRRFRIAHLTGSAALHLSPDELAGLRRFVTSGGTLMVDAAGGSAAFTESVEQQISDALKREARILPKDNLLITGEGVSDAVSLERVAYRRSVRRTRRGAEPMLRGIRVGQRIAVIFSPLDYSTGLAGAQAFGCLGYAPQSALRLVRNLVLYANLSTREKAELARGD